MKDVFNIWQEIKEGTVEYEVPEVGVSDGIYMTSDYVFKTGSDNDIWKNMYVNIEAQENGVKTPSVVWYSEDEDVVTYNRIEGTMLSNTDEIRSNKVAYKVGEQLRNMHSDSYDGYGSTSEWDDISGEYKTYDEFVHKYLTSCMEIPEESVFKDFVYKCSDIIKSTEVPEKTKSSLLHADLHSENIIVSQDDVYIIDFENAKLGPPEMDLIHSYLMLNQGKGSQFVDNFLSGYGLKIDEMSKIGVCMGVLKEVTAARWWEKKSGNYVDDRKKTLEEFTNEYL